ncbi:MAG: hypothetical protein CMJ47_11180 [Planctomyces sp.]|mgnify:CR=1 FL=1|nr:hypothetical protein [Planctomyces sp.]
MNSHIDDYSKHFDPDYELPDPLPAEELSPATRMLFGWTVQVAGAGMLIFGAMNLILATANGTIAPPYGGVLTEGLPTLALATAGFGWIVAGFGIRRSSLMTAAVGGLIGLIAGFYCTPMAW